jgi:hypothetical protein
MSFRAENVRYLQNQAWGGPAEGVIRRFRKHAVTAIRPADSEGVFRLLIAVLQAIS